MPKTEPAKTSTAKTAAKPITKKPKVIKADLEETKTEIESYVPKITHFTKVKKDTADMITESQAQTTKNEEIEAEQFSEQKDKAKSKLESLKKTYSNNDEKAKVAEVQISTAIEEKPQKSELGLDQNDLQAIQKDFKNPIQNSNLVKKSLGLPSFLNRSSRATTQTLENQSLASNESFKKPEPMMPNGEAHNSLASIFTRDKDEIGNIKRVFRKSIIFLTIALLSFGLTSLASSNFVLQSLLTMIFTGFGFIALTNIFFIIVAHRTYVWLFLLGQFIILAITQYPYSTNLSTLIIGLVTVLLTYLAYLDLEKVQLGSRLFSIPYIVGESTKILSTVIIFIVCLSSFNQIESRGVDKFIADSVLSIPQVMEKVAVPVYQNTILKGTSVDFSQSSNTTVKTLICAERKLNCDTKNSTVLSPEELAKIQNGCKTDGTGESGCAALVDQAQTTVLETYKNQDLSGLGLTLGTKLDETNSQPVLKQLIQAKIKKQVDPTKLSFLPSYVPTKSLIPFVVALFLFIILSIFKFIIVWIGYVVTWILWKLLQITGFVRLDIEMVEAEIVGI